MMQICYMSDVSNKLDQNQFGIAMWHGDVVWYGLPCWECGDLVDCDDHHGKGWQGIIRVIQVVPLSHFAGPASMTF